MRSRIDATTLAQFVRLESCERYLWYQLHPRDTRELLRTWRVTKQPLAILLRTRGARDEHEVVQALEAEGLEIVDLSESGPEVVVQELRAPRSKALLQPKLRAELQGFEAAGVADVVLVRPGGAGLELEVRDAKASRKDRPEHRIQIAFYGMLLQRVAEEAGVPISDLTGSVWRIPAGPGDEQPRPFRLEPYEEAVRLLLDDRGVVPRIARASRQEARFHLTYKCDGCTYNALCMREAAETRSLALVPFLSLRDRSTLEREGVRDIGALARLKELPPDGRGALRPARGRRSRQVLARLEAEWPLCANLDLHIQRARQVARARGDFVEALRYIIGSGFGSLPDPEEHPGLVQVFVEGQHDYLQDALYLAAALVVGPGGETAEVIELADGPPDLEAEGELVVRWVTRLLDEVRKVAGEEALLHVYVYDRYDQKVLLDALRRHLDRLSALPDFFDLLTETAALSQSMFSFLADEVRDRKNLGILSHSLPMAARRLGFDWHVDGVEYHRRFQARIFDNRRRLDGRWYESAARFNSQIPLEYAYAAWGLLPEPESGEDRPLVEPFLVSREELLGFARARLHALQHVERSFPRKNRALRKEAVRVPGPRRAPRRVRLADVLVEFLYIEHHTKLQALLLHYAQPVERRVASGESILVEALEGATDGLCRFRFRFEEARLDPAAALAQMNPKEGDWMVLGDPATTRPWDILKGRLVVIRKIDDRGLVAELRWMRSSAGPFRYRHDNSRRVERGKRYVLDPMADDLVARRLLDACQHAEGNVLLGWIEAGGGAVRRRRARPGERAAVEEFARALEQAPSILTPTQRQAEVIAERLTEPVLLVQGPPGTGKTHTIA